MTEPSENHCKMKRVYKPNPVSANGGGDHSSRPTVTCRLERPTRKRRPIARTLDGPSIAFSYLALHHEEFTWPSSVATDAGELLPHRFTLDPCGQVYSLLHLSSSSHQGCPDVIRLAALWCSDFPLLPMAKAITRRASLQGKLSIAKNVEHSNDLLQTT